MPSHWDGKQCILELKGADYNWRQMEWIGFWFEWKARHLLEGVIGGGGGPTFGRTTFDYKNQYVWDLKAHPTQGGRSDWVVLNDCEAIDLCIAKHGGIGAIVCSGTAVMDETGEFKLWHDVLKGGVSKYERERIGRNAPSRTRKKSFYVERLSALFFTAPILKSGIAEGWIDRFQEGMRNADGSPRKPKYEINLAANGCRTGPLVAEV